MIENWLFLKEDDVVGAEGRGEEGEGENEVEEDVDKDATEDATEDVVENVVDESIVGLVCDRIKI